MSSLVLPLNIGPMIMEMLPLPGSRADTRWPLDTAFEVIIVPLPNTISSTLSTISSTSDANCYYSSCKTTADELLRRPGSRVHTDYCTGRAGGGGCVMDLSMTHESA